jgi:hypothetical protein
VNAERDIEMAQRALEANERASASALYESAARTLADTEPRRAAHLFIMAAWYADSARKEGLAKHAQRIYEAEGDDEKIAEAALLRAAEAEQIGDYDSAWDFYLTCARHASICLAQILVNTPHQTPRDPMPTMEILFDQLAHCRARLNALEKYE